MIPLNTPYATIEAHELSGHSRVYDVIVAHSDSVQVCRFGAIDWNHARAIVDAINTGASWVES